MVQLTKFTGIKNKGKTVTILVRGSNELVLDEAERSIHDALCVVRSLVRPKLVKCTRVRVYVCVKA